MLTPALLALIQGGITDPLRMSNLTRPSAPDVILHGALLAALAPSTTELVLSMSDMFVRLGRSSHLPHTRHFTHTPNPAPHPSCLAGFLSPASRGALMTAMLVMYLLLAVAAGFSSVWLWGMIHRGFEGWPGLAWRVAAYFPGISLALLTVLNILIHHTGSSGSIPLGAFFSLLALWFLISIPLCFSGAPPPPRPAADQLPPQPAYCPAPCPRCAEGQCLAVGVRLGAALHSPPVLAPAPVPLPSTACHAVLGRGIRGCQAWAAAALGAAGRQRHAGVCRGCTGDQAGGAALPDAHQPDPAAHPAPPLGLPPMGALPGCRPAALRHPVCGAVLRNDLHLAGTSPILPAWH